MAIPRVIRTGTGLLDALRCEADQPRFCRNCGDPAPSLDDTDWDGRTPSGTWRPCPAPSPGRPLIDCGVGGHMYTEDSPQAN